MILALLSIWMGGAQATELAITSAVQLPQPLTLGVQATSEQLPNWAAFYEAGFFAYPLASSTRSISTYSMEAGVRYHPFSNPFYVAGELGFRQLSLTVDISNLKQDGVSLADSATANLGTFFVGALVGGEWRLRPSLGIAVDFGIQAALIHAGGITIHAAPGEDDGTDNSVSDRQEMKRISGLPFPQIAVLRLIWYI